MFQSFFRFDLLRTIKIMEINYSLANDFNDGLDNGQFQLEIRSNADITELCTHINTNGDDVSIYFENALNGTELNILDTLVSLHIPIPEYTYLMRFSPKTTVIDTSTYILIGTFYLTNVTIPIKKIEIVSYMDFGSTSFTVKLIYRNTNTVIAEGTFSNTNFSINTITNIDFSPTDIGLIDIIASRISSETIKHAYISDIVLWGY